MAQKNLALMQKHATWAIFFISGFGSATWAPLIPVLRERLAIGEDTLGMLLLCLGVGSLLIMPFAGTVAAKFGCRKVLTTVSIMFAALLLIICQVSTLQAMLLTVVIFGATMGCLDVVMNMHAVMVEKSLGKRIMSGVHAMWSIGGFVGAGLFGVWVGFFGLSPFMSTLIAAVIMMLILAYFARYLMPTGGKTGGSIIAIPRGVVIFIGIVTCIAYLVEGAVMDWSGVFLTTSRGFDMSMAGTGFTVFSAAMLTMRLIGDGLIQAVGQRIIVLAGCVIAFTGFMLIIFADMKFLLYGGFFLIGIGSANIVPIFYSLTGKQKVMPINKAVPAVSTLAYAGILVGPAVIGFLAHQTSLYASFGFLAALIVLQIFIASYIFRRGV